MVKVRFNAWTAEGDNALESLIKSVLVELDPRVVRRWVRRVMKHKRMLGFGWLLFGFVARLFGVARLVDELWTRLDVNAQTRNELRDNIHGMLSDWVNRSDRAGRSLVVFIDDLDRCDDDVVVGVCEAVKLYLDAPGLIFVIGCDLSVLARGVAGPARGGASEGRQYLEKIVQVAYRVPMPNADEIRQLIVGCGARAGINHLLNPTVVDILADGTARNPRRIKRIINSFVLEHHIDPAWRRPPLDSALLISAILLRDIYPSFYSVLVDSTAGDDPIGDFLDYAVVRARAADPRLAGDAWWATARRIFRKHGLQLPEKSDARDAGMRSQLEELERALPEEYPQLARNDPFVALLRAIGDSDRRSALRSRLINNPLGTESLSPATVEAESGESSSFVSS
jgi:hypothetical protein